MDLTKIHLPDVVRRTIPFSTLAESVALEIVLSFLHGGRPMQHQRLAAISAVDQSREHIGFIHLFRSPLFVLAHSLYDVPPLLSDQRLMGVLHQYLLTLWTENVLFIFVGDGRIPQPRHMTQAYDPGRPCCQESP